MCEVNRRESENIEKTALLYNIANLKIDNSIGGGKCQIVL